MNGILTRNVPGKPVWWTLAFALILLLTVGSSTALAQAPVGSGYYVRSGDTYHSIAYRHGITAQQLASINPGIRLYKYPKVGTTLNVPLPGLIGPAPSQCPQMHTVNPNETLDWIGGAYGVAPNALAQLNHLPAGTALNPGNILCLPSYAKLNYGFPGVGPAPAPVPPPMAPAPVYVPAPPPAPAPHTPAGPWHASYYHYQTPARLVLNRTDAAINFNWGRSSPARTVRADMFSVSWTNTFHFNGRNYRFVALSDDGVRVWVGNTLVIDGWIPQSATLYFKDHAPPAGVHLVKVEYYDSGADAQIMVDWAPN